jgi:hypothetical protein
VTFVDYQGREEFRGVLVTLADVRDLADSNDQLRRDNEDLRRENTDLRQALVTAEHRQSVALREVQTIVHTLLAPVAGYLQLLARRPHTLAHQRVEDLLTMRVLPQLQRLVEAVDRMSRDVDTSTRDRRQG